MTNYTIIELLIKKGKTENLLNKINQLYLLNQLTEEEYNKVIQSLEKTNSKFDT